MYIATASNCLKFHEFPSGKEVYHYASGILSTETIRSISWCKDSNWLALVPHKGATEILSIKNNLKLLHTITSIDQPTCAVFQNTTKKNLAVGTNDCKVMIYDIKSKSIKKQFPKAGATVTHVDFTAKDTHLVAACQSGDVNLYSNLTNNLSAVLRVPKSESVTAVRTNPNKRNLIVGGSGEGIVVVWDSNVNKSKFVMDSHKAPVTSVAFSPVHNDLIVSTGLDRQFCFYDIQVNKCIASVSVENSLMAIDFAEGGTSFLVASQNGKVYIYDSRKIQEPVSTFQAHTNTIKHMSCQDILSDSTSNSSFIEESVQNSVPSRTPTSETAKPREGGSRVSDFFGIFPLPNNMSIQNNSPAESLIGKPTADDQDSFMEELGLPQDTIASEEGVLSDAINQWVEETDQHKSPYVSKTLNLSKNVRSFSTPKIGHVNPAEQPTPSPLNSNFNLNEIQRIIQGTIRDEMRQTFNEIKQELSFQLLSETSQVKRVCYDLHMGLIEEFIKMENNFNNIRQKLDPDVVNQELYLAEENAMLKQRIAYLEEQLENISLNKNQNGYTS